MDSGIGLTEIDQWDLQDIENMRLTLEMKVAHTDAHGKFMEDKIKELSNQNKNK